MTATLDSLRKETEKVIRDFRHAVLECKTAEDMEWKPVTVCTEPREFTADGLQAVFCYGLDSVFFRMRMTLDNFWYRLDLPWETVRQAFQGNLLEGTAGCVLRTEMKSRMAEIWADHASDMNLAACIWKMDGKEKHMTFRSMNSPYWISRAFAADGLFSIGSIKEILSSECQPAGMSLYRECLFGANWTLGGRQLEGDCPEVKTLCWPPAEPDGSENGPIYPFMPQPAGIRP